MKHEFWWSRAGTAKRIAACLLTVLALAGMVFCYTPAGRDFWSAAFRTTGFAGRIPSDSLLTVHFLDVGKADAILLECGGHYALLDAGTYDRREDVCIYLKKQGVERLDYLIASHPDKDHIGGMAQVLEEYPVAKMIQAPLREELLPDTEEYRLLTEQLEKKRVPVSTIPAGKQVSLGGAVLKVIGPVREYEDTNNSSLVLRLEYQGFSVLLCGDIEKEAEQDLLQSGADLSADVLKVPHHGSDSSSAKKFLNAVSPAYAVISSGPDKNKLPKSEVLRRMEKAGAEIYRTDTDGTVVAAYDGKQVTVITEK